MVQRPAEAPNVVAAEPPVLPAAVPAGQRVAVLVDLGWLRDEARAAGGELSHRKLAKALVGNRSLVRAIAFATEDHAKFGTSLAANGFEIESAEDESAIPVAIAVDALALATRVDAIVLAGDARRLAPLLRTLRAQGLRTETAGFSAARSAIASSHVSLGKDALFVP